MLHPPWPAPPSRACDSRAPAQVGPCMTQQLCHHHLEILSKPGCRGPAFSLCTGAKRSVPGPLLWSWLVPAPQTVLGRAWGKAHTLHLPSRPPGASSSPSGGVRARTPSRGFRAPCCPRTPSRASVQRGCSRASLPPSPENRTPRLPLQCSPQRFMEGLFPADRPRPSAWLCCRAFRHPLPPRLPSRH